jgi:hypothetical protein
MAKAKTSGTGSAHKSQTKKRPGIHSKKKSSKSKSSKNYKKMYKGQGR